MGASKLSKEDKIDRSRYRLLEHEKSIKVLKEEVKELKDYILRVKEVLSLVSGYGDRIEYLEKKIRDLSYFSNRPIR